MTRGKKYIEKSKLTENAGFLNPEKGIELLKQLNYAKFDETVEAHFNLGIDPRHADQQLRGTVVLPHGIGKTIKIAVIAKGEKLQEAQKAGADEVGSDDLVEKIEKGWLDFDLLIATPDMMAKIGKLGRILGAKGLMPTPKNGTVTLEVAQAVNDFKSGKIEYRNDKTGNIHIIVGKISYEPKKIEEKRLNQFC